MKLKSRYSCWRIELNLFYLALSFFTRIPVPNSMKYSEKMLNQSARYFSLVGVLLAMLLLLVESVIARYLPTDVIIVLLMVLSVLLTGAFHEDGLADMADGIGGGFTVERRLTIMKDSRIGTYGTVSLILTLLLKFSLLTHIYQYSLSYADFALTLITAYALSRAMAISLIYNLPYVADIDASKSKPLAQKQSNVELLIALSLALVPLFYFPMITVTLVCITLLLFRQCFAKWLLARLGGYTGDCLGAAQQIAELIIYLVIIASFSNVNSSLLNQGGIL